VLVAQIPIFLQSLVDDHFEVQWHLRIKLQRRAGLLVQDRSADFSRACALEWHLSGRHLIQHCTEGKQIASRIQFFRSNLLGRHIRYCAKHRSRTGEMFIGARGGGLSILCSYLARRTDGKRDLR
jgi:hypothetical protein